MPLSQRRWSVWRSGFGSWDEGGLTAKMIMGFEHNVLHAHAQKCIRSTMERRMPQLDLNVGTWMWAIQQQLFFLSFPRLSIDATYGSTPPLFLEWVRNPQRKLSEIVFPAPEAGQKWGPWANANALAAARWKCQTWAPKSQTCEIKNNKTLLNRIICVYTYIYICVCVWYVLHKRRHHNMCTYIYIYMQMISWLIIHNKSTGEHIYEN